MIEIRRLPASDIERIREVDRSERITAAYRQHGGEVERYSVDWDVPRWTPAEVADRVKRWRRLLDAGGALLGAFVGGNLAGFAILRFALTAEMA
jgi:hypothetical protein